LHQTELGKQIRIDIAWIQQEAGTSAGILDDTQTDLDYIKDGWVMGIHRFLQTVDGAIKLMGNALPQTYHQDDVHLMDLFRVHGVPTSDLRILNRCRLYLQVTQLSDITNLAGTHI
jgi:hypothetical protein